MKNANDITREKFIGKSLLNNSIIGDKVRLLIEGGSEVVTKKEALDRASEQEKDLICLSSSGEFPVCKIMDFGKFSYQERKKIKKPKNSTVKEVTFTSLTQEGDINTKVNKIVSWITDLNSSVMINMKTILKGRRTKEEYENNRKESYNKCFLIIKNIEEKLVNCKISLKDKKINFVGRRYFFTIQKTKK